MTAISNDLRKRIVERYLHGGESYESVAEHFSVGRATVNRVINRVRRTGAVSLKKCPFVRPSRTGQTSNSSGKRSGTNPDGLVLTPTGSAAQSSTRCGTSPAPVELPYPSGEVALTCEHSAIVGSLRERAASLAEIDYVPYARVALKLAHARNNHDLLLANRSSRTLGAAVDHWIASGFMHSSEDDALRAHYHRLWEVPHVAEEQSA